MQQIGNPFAYFAGLDGRALELGKIYIGVAGQDPQTNPQNVYWDEAGTQIAAQPIRTAAGTPMNNGTPARIYVSGSFSIRVRTQSDVQVFYMSSIDPGGAASPDGGIIDMADYGAVGDDTTDNLAAFNTALAAITTAMTYGTVGPVIRFPAGKFYFSGPINLKKTVVIEGAGGAGQAGPEMTQLRFASNSRGIIINRSDTNNGDTIVSATTGADGTVIRNLQLYGAGATATAHGIYAKARCVIENVNVGGFGGHGIFVAGDSNAANPTLYGNANCTRITGGRMDANRGSGIRLEGGDANAFTIIGVDVVGNGRWGIEDRSFLGGTIIGCHADLNGTYSVSAGRASSLPGVVTQGGTQYYVVPDQETAAATTTPGTNLAIWRPMINAIAGAYAPAWVSGTAILQGGGYCSLAAAGSTQYYGCYTEGDQAATFLLGSAANNGGVNGAGTDGPWWNSVLGAPTSNRGFTAQRTESALTQTVGLGVDYTNGDILAFSETNEAPSTWRLKYRGNKNLTFTYANTTNNEPFLITGSGTNFQFGRGAAVPYRMALPEIFLGDTTSANGPRSITFAAAAPAAGTHAQGDVVFNTGAAVGQPKGWHCTVAGTPGTWVSMGNL